MSQSTSPADQRSVQDASALSEEATQSRSSSAADAVLSAGNDASLNDEPENNDLEPFLRVLDPVSERVRALIEPLLDFEGCELVQMVLARSRQSTHVRIFADVKDVDKAIGLEMLTRMNRLIGDLLDVESAEHGLFSGAYVVEVSSPGLDRPLTKKSHFMTAKGQVIKLRSRINLGEGKGVTGTLTDVSSDSVTVLPQGMTDPERALNLFFEDVESAHVIAQFDDSTAKKVRPNKRTKKKSTKPSKSTS